MHNRDMIWQTSDGRKLKLKDITSAHLVNILHHIEENKNTFYHTYGSTRMADAKHNIIQEIRLRKLNRLEIDNQENLF